MFICNTHALASELPEQDEIQLLIDVSGSMKQTDPKNMRIEASKLLISLLPEKSIASIWLFAEKTTALVHSDAVDAEWKKKALQKTGNIHSNGLYTDIEKAVQTALISGFAGKGRKHLILLTDGLVDISKDIMVSADSRERILSEWIPKLQQKNIQVETIALSNQADKELLDKLAFDTGGWTENAESAEQLQRAFLKMILKASPKDSLPLTGNRFAVDSGVKEFSLLVLKKSNSLPSKLFTPAEKKIDKQNTPDHVAWLESASYDLITVNHPEMGNWRLEADVDPDDQVMIITDLKMQVEELSNYLSQIEPLAIKIHFTDQDKLISRADFLEVMTVTVSLDQQPPQILQPVSGKPGYFTYIFNELTQGKHNLAIVADGKTFNRDIRREFSVIAEPIRIEKQIDYDKREVTLKLQPDLSLIDAGSLVIEAKINRADKPVETHTIEAKDGLWSIKLDDLPPGTEVTVNFSAMAKTTDGKPILPVIKPFKIDDAVFTPVVNPDLHESEQTGSEAHPVQAENVEEKHEKSMPAPTDWLQVGAIILGVNLLFVGGGFLIFRAMKRIRLEKQQQLLERLS